MTSQRGPHVHTSPPCRIVISNELSQDANSGTELINGLLYAALRICPTHVRSTYPAMRTVLLEFLIELSAECVCLLPATLGVYAV